MNLRSSISFFSILMVAFYKLKSYPYSFLLLTLFLILNSCKSVSVQNLETKLKRTSIEQRALYQYQNDDRMETVLKIVEVTQSIKKTESYLDVKYPTSNIINKYNLINLEMYKVDKAKEGLFMQLRDLYYNLGILYEKRADIEEAIGAFNSAIVLDSNFTNAFTHLGLACAYHKDFTNAIYAYNRLIELDPKEESYYWLLAELYEKVGSYDFATNTLRKLMKLGVNDAIVLFRIGMVYLNSKEFSKADSFLQQALKKDGNNIQTLFSLGITKVLLNQYQASVVYFEKILLLDPYNYDACYNLGLIYYGLIKDKDKGNNYFAQADNMKNR